MNTKTKEKPTLTDHEMLPPAASKVVELSTRRAPLDRLPVTRFFGVPPRASLYHTKRAEDARQRAESEVPAWLVQAREVLSDAGIGRTYAEYADTADHNAMTLAYALAYAECGLTVLDSHAIDARTGEGTGIVSGQKSAKIPRGAKWQTRASADAEQIKNFWIGAGKYPPTKNGDVFDYARVGAPRNVSIVFTEGCRLFCLDEDGAEGMAAVRALEEVHGELPRTATSISGSGVGQHRIWRSKRPILNTGSKLAPKVDIRGEGGQIIAAPSVHATGGYYIWKEGCAPWGGIAYAPDWLEDLAFNASASNAPNHSDRSSARTASGNPTNGSTTHGFAAICDSIGDGDDREGFDQPIYRAACSWWATNPNGDPEALFTRLRRTIDEAPRDETNDRAKYDTDEYLAARIEQARAYIEANRDEDAPQGAAANADDRDADDRDPDAEREEVRALEAARAILRDHLKTVDGETGLTAGAVQVATSHLLGLGYSAEDAASYVSEAESKVLRQLTARDEDRQHDPVAEARKEAAGSTVPPILASLYDERLVDADGFLVKPADKPELYRAYNISPKVANAEKLMREEIRVQMYRNLNARFSWVVLDGEAKWAIRGADGDAVRLRKEATLAKLYINRAVHYSEGEGEKAKVKSLKPAEVLTYARERATYLDTCVEPDPRKAAAAAAKGSYNLWTGFAVKPVEGDWSKLRGHILDQICGGNVDWFNWLMTWLSSTFARPGVKVPSSVAVIGEQGTGKSKVFDWVRYAIGAGALKVSAGRHLTGNFNAHLDGKVFLTCEEAFWGGEKQAAGVLKDLITSDTLQIEGKFETVVSRPNYVSVSFVSNTKWVIPTDGEDARRFLVLECLATRKQDAKFFGEIDDQMENGGVEAMVYELTNWNPEAVGLTWASLRNPPITEGLRQQAGLGLHGPAARLVEIIENGSLSGRCADGAVFYYQLSDESSTDVARQHLYHALCGGTDRGNVNGEAKEAIERFFGPDADGGDKKRVVNYFGGLRHMADDAANDLMAADDADQTSLRVQMKDRERFVTIPALSTMTALLAQYGRG